MPGKGGRKLSYPGETLYKKLKRKGFNVAYEPGRDMRNTELATNPINFGSLVEDSPARAGNRMLGEILTEKYPRASMRRARREIQQGERATVGELTARSAIKTSKRLTQHKPSWDTFSSWSTQADKIKRRYSRRKIRGLLGLGLAAASFRSSIQEAGKK